MTTKKTENQKTEEEQLAAAVEKAAATGVPQDVSAVLPKGKTGEIVDNTPQVRQAAVAMPSGNIREDY